MTQHRQLSILQAIGFLADRPLALTFIALSILYYLVSGIILHFANNYLVFCFNNLVSLLLPSIACAYLLRPRRFALIAKKFLIVASLFTCFYLLIFVITTRVLMPFIFSPAASNRQIVNNITPYFYTAFWFFLAPIPPLLIGGWYQRRDYLMKFFVSGWIKIVVASWIIRGAGFLCLEFLPSSFKVIGTMIVGLGPWPILLYCMLFLKQEPIFDYRPLDPSGAPYYQSNFADMSHDQTYEYATDFALSVPERMMQLDNYLKATRAHIELNYQPYSLVLLWYWFQAHIIKLSVDSEELLQQTQELPQFQDLIEMGRYSNETLMLGIDIGIYLCETIRNACPSLHWDVVHEGPGIDPSDLGKPALTGFPDGRVFEPFHMMWQQYDKAWKRPKRKVLTELFVDWTSGLNAGAL